MSKRTDYIYVKDNENYVAKIKKENLTDEYTVITKEEWAELSGENYYAKTFTHGGRREGSGRKKLNRNINIRVTVYEKDLLDFLRENCIDPGDIKKQLA